MKKIRCIILLCFTVCGLFLHAQSRIDSVQFFLEENILNVTLTTDISKLLNQKMKKDYYQKAVFNCKLPDSSEVSEEIQINARGIFRRSYCFMPPLKLNFHNSIPSKLYSLNSLKLVCPCKTSALNEQYLLKEFLIYKIYNLLTEKSFRVRLLRLTYQDSREKKKPFTGYAFLVEDVDAMAKRNRCKEWKNGKIYTENTQHDQMTMVAVFQYMIGNTDYAGLVNTDYAVPDPLLGTESVLQRVYRGFPRTMSELQAVFDIFNKQKENVYSLIKNFEPLSAQNKKEMIYYLDDFYQTINNQQQAESIFVDNARQQ